MGCLFVGVVPHGQKTCRLFHYDKIFVFVDDVELSATQYGERTGKVDRYLIAWREWSIELSKRLPVYCHMMMGKHRLDVALAFRGKYGVEERE